MVEQVAVDRRETPGRTVGALGTHGIDGVDHGTGPGQLTQLVVADAGGIATAVEALVDLAGGGLEHRGVDPGAVAEALAQPAHVLDQAIAFGVAEGRRQAQGLGQQHLAQVMDHGAGDDGLAQLAGQAVFQQIDQQDRHRQAVAYRPGLAGQEPQREQHAVAVLVVQGQQVVGLARQARAMDAAALNQLHRLGVQVAGYAGQPLGHDGGIGFRLATTKAWAAAPCR